MPPGTGRRYRTPGETESQCSDVFEGRFPKGEDDDLPRRELILINFPFIKVNFPGGKKRRKFRVKRHSANTPFPQGKNLSLMTGGFVCANQLQSNR